MIMIDRVCFGYDPVCCGLLWFRLLAGVLSSLRTPSALLKKVTPASIFIVFICIFQISLEVMGRGYDEDFSSFHDHEHMPGSRTPVAHKMNE